MSGNSVRRVLIYRLGSLGDMAISVPVFRLVRRAFPAAEIRLLTNKPVDQRAPAAVAVLEGSGLVDGYLSYTVGTRDVWELGQLVARLRWWRPEIAIYLAAARGTAAAARDARFLKLCGARSVLGVPFTAAQQSNFYGADPGSAAAREWLFAGALESEAARLARCVAELGDAQLEAPESWSLGLTTRERAEARAALDVALTGAVRAPIAVSLGTKVQAKDWGRENWRHLLTRLASTAGNGRALVLLGAAEEAEASDYAAQDWSGGGGGPVLNLCGRLKPRESAAALEGCALFLGHDSGPMHLAASVGTPVVAVFSARNIPRQWFPAGPQHEVLYHRVECWGCELETCLEQGKKCILSISVEEVAAAAERTLRRGKHPGTASEASIS